MDLKNAFGMSLERIFKVKQWCCLDRCERTNEREEIFIVISRQRSRAARRQHLIAFREALIWMLLWMQFYVQPVMPHFQLLNFSLLMVLREQSSGLQLEVQSDLYYGWYYYHHPRATTEHDIFYRWKENSRVLENLLISLIISISNQNDQRTLSCERFLCDFRDFHILWI